MPGPVSEDFLGLALPAAVKRVLERVPTRQPKTASEILSVLERHNAAPTSEDPVKSVQTALNRRRKAEGDVVHVIHGRWGLKEWYTGEEIAQFQGQQDGANARDKQLHSERMKIGIQRVRATGAHYGAAPKITPLQWERALELVRSGVTKMSEIHREVIKLTPKGEKPMVPMTISRQKDKLLALEAYPERWQAYFDADPPAAPASDDEGSLRVVK